MTNREVVLPAVHVDDLFWNKQINNAIENVIPYQWRVLNDNEPDAAPSHAIANFRIAAGLEEGEFYGFQFQDSDVAKWMEAAAYSLLYKDDPTLREEMEQVIDLLEKAQQPDGYLDTHYIVKKPDKKWQEITHGHELYCAGHMLEAAVAYYQVTGSDRFMKVMDRVVDLVDATFGKEPGKKDGYPGHEEIELALMKAYRATGKEKYLRLAEYFILNRGAVPGFKAEERFKEGEKNKAYNATYFQAHAPVIEQNTIEGHSVRAMYLMTGAADVALETGNQALRDAMDRLWKNTVNRRMYVTGGLGSQDEGERFTIDYDLPNDTCYTETCAAIGLAMWSLRMLRMDPKEEYAAVMERALYNNVLSGISQDGEHYFYVNPLMVKPDAAHFRQDQRSVETQRVKWFGCACCPPNVIRTLTGLGSYIYTKKDDVIYQHLYIGNRAEIDLNGNTVSLKCTSEMPWNGKAHISAKSSAPVKLALRVPSYAKYMTFVQDKKMLPEFETTNGYVVLTIDGSSEIDVTFAMEPVVVCANPKVAEDNGKVCVLRGPLVYCAEEKDNGQLLQNFRMDIVQKPVVSDSVEFGGIKALTVQGVQMKPWDEDILYRSISETKEEKRWLKLIPYYLWANRGEGEMTVWMNRC